MNTDTNPIIKEDTVPKPKKQAKPKKLQAKKENQSCLECDFVAHTKLLVKKHMILKHPDKLSIGFKCDFCQKIFKSQSQLDNHLSIHTGNKVYECTHCKLTFGTNGELVRHTRYKHTLEKPHKCELCDYAAVELSKLKRHQRVHTDERPYMCPYCDYASRDTFRLKRHIRTHTGEKPYKCPLCESAFSQSNSLKIHMKRHGSISTINESSFPKTNLPQTSNESSSNPTHTPNDQSILLECQECSMKFTCQKVFDEHLIEHTGERPYECDICLMKFARTSTLRFHRLSHNEEHSRNLKKRLRTINSKTQNVNLSINATLNNSSNTANTRPKRKQSSPTFIKDEDSDVDGSNSNDSIDPATKKPKLNEN